jgi:hypothetical protein
MYVGPPGRSRQPGVTRCSRMRTRAICARTSSSAAGGSPASLSHRMRCRETQGGKGKMTLGFGTVAQFCLMSDHLGPSIKIQRTKSIAARWAPAYGPLAHADARCRLTGQAECGPLPLAEIVFSLTGPLNKFCLLYFCIIRIIILLKIA